MRVEGDLTIETAERRRAELVEAARSGEMCFELSGIGRADSSALSIMLAVRRLQPEARFEAVPASIATLAQLYGVAGLLGLGADNKTI